MMNSVADGYRESSGSIMKSGIGILFVLATSLVNSQHAASRYGEPLAQLVDLPLTSAAIKFRGDGDCRVPVLTPVTVFKGGATTGEKVTVRLDTIANRYEIRIEASGSSDRQGTTHSGTLKLERSDCLYRMSGETGAQLAVNKDGILFGGITSGTSDETSPALIVAFKNTSHNVADLIGDWWVFDSDHQHNNQEGTTDLTTAERSAAAYETRIEASGHFRNCDLKDRVVTQCWRYGNIFFNGTDFVSQEEDGNSAMLVVGRVAGKYVPILCSKR